MMLRTLPPPTNARIVIKEEADELDALATLFGRETAAPAQNARAAVVVDKENLSNPNDVAARQEVSPPF